jgi:hypothetical protein
MKKLSGFTASTARSAVREVAGLVLVGLGLGLVGGAGARAGRKATKRAQVET